MLSNPMRLYLTMTAISLFLFYQFSVYAHEFLTNVETDHSHQWTDIEFNKLHDIFDSSAFAFENLL